MNPAAPVRPALFLIHPAWAAALATLVTNDWVLKGSGLLDPIITGKLSDFAGMVVAPALFAALIGARTRRGLFRCHVAVGAAFGLLKLVPALPLACERLGAVLGVPLSIRCDPTDLIALPLLVVSFRSSARANGVVEAWKRVATAAAGAIGLLACVATSMPPPRPPQLGPHAVAFYDRSEHRLHVLDRATGTSLGAYGSGALPAMIDRVVVITEGESVRGIDLLTRRRSWSLPTSGEPTLTACGEAVLVTDERATWLVEASTGRVRGRTASALDSASCAHGLVLHTETWEHPFLGLTKQDLVARDATTGDKVWRQRTQELLYLRDVQAFGPALLLAPAGSSDPAVLLDPRQGRPLWKRDLPGGNYLVAGSTAAIFSDRDALIAIDLDGNELWRGTGWLMAASERRVFIRSMDPDARLQALDPHSGRLLWSASTELGFWAGGSADEELFVAETSSPSSPGSLPIVAIDAATGNERWRGSPAN
jgi:outer membrane protein assembly factor BamB